MAEETSKPRKRRIPILPCLFLPLSLCFCCTGYLGLLGLMPPQLPAEDVAVGANYRPWQINTFLPVNWAQLGTTEAGGEFIPTPDESQTQIALQQTQAPSPTIAVTSTIAQTNTPIFTNTAVQTNTPIFTNTAVRTNTPVFTNTPVRTNTPLFTNTPIFTNTPVFTNTAVRTNTPIFTNTPIRTNTPLFTNTPIFTNTPVFTNTALPSSTPLPTNTPQPTPVDTNTPQPTTPPTSEPPPPDTPVPALAPSANPDMALTPTNTAVVINVLANDTDLDSTLVPSSVTIVTPPVSGGTAINPLTGEITFTPAPAFTGSITFTYQVQDSQGLWSNAALVTVLVGFPPVANNDSAFTGENTAVVIPVLGNDSDPDGVLVPATTTIGTFPTNGGVSVNPLNGDVTYTPNPAFVGIDTFTYTVQDNSGLTSNIATVTVTVCLASNPVDGTFPDGFIASVNPPNGSTNIALATNTITITFTQDMGANVGAIGQYGLSQQGAPGQNVQILNVNYDSGTDTAIITFDNGDADWINNTIYEFEMKGSLQNICGINQGGVDVITTLQTAP